MPVLLSKLIDGAYSSSKESDINVGNEFRAVKGNELLQTTAIVPEKVLKSLGKLVGQAPAASR